MTGGRRPPRRVFLLDDYTVGWPNGTDIAPEFLYEITRPTGAALKREVLRSLDDAEAEYAAQCDRMPELSRFFGIFIRMFYDDYVPPHFHARYGKHTVTVDIRDGSIRTHSFPARAVRLVLAWHELHRAALMENWERMRDGGAPNPIAPLE